MTAYVSAEWNGNCGKSVWKDAGENHHGVICGFITTWLEGGGLRKTVTIFSLLAS
jgi:hypothetical protein